MCKRANCNNPNWCFISDEYLFGSILLIVPLVLFLGVAITCIGIYSVYHGVNSQRYNETNCTILNFAIGNYSDNRKYMYYYPQLVRNFVTCLRFPVFAYQKPGTVYEPRNDYSECNRKVSNERFSSNDITLHEHNLSIRI